MGLKKSETSKTERKQDIVCTNFPKRWGFVYTWEINIVLVPGLKGSYQWLIHVYHISNNRISIFPFFFFFFYSHSFSSNVLYSSWNQTFHHIWQRKCMFCRPGLEYANCIHCRGVLSLPYQMGFVWYDNKMHLMVRDRGVPFIAIPPRFTLAPLRLLPIFS